MLKKKGLTKRLLKWVFILAVTITAASFLIPVYPEAPEETREPIVALNVSPSGERLLLRTLAHDYDFALPPNRLNELSSARYDRLPSLGGTRVGLDRIMVQSTGMAATRISIVLGGYDSRQGETKGSLLPDDLRSDLADIGFAPSNGNSVGDFDTPLYMVWNTELSGQQYPANSREAYSGVDLTTSAASEATVAADDGPALKQNRRLNAALRPLRALREGVETVVMALYMLITGASPAPRG
ncbi:hypothetical protein KK141_11300 [Dyella sp. LX-66]|uniref:hypothetical protein n=1 Tax=unclassified Dyella TaxID=2634549 RepID=UPI001BE0CCBD|nr:MULTISPECIES: hypothetical protein [unclassified Dyella]MBT2118891.1 hypothetical protein [Dyella sp. LX-1]MBT2140116.1 hypothetical protein [Dyella sp. LX-66]